MIWENVRPITRTRSVFDTVSRNPRLSIIGGPQIDERGMETATSQLEHRVSELVEGALERYAQGGRERPR
jgi:hypothetical protein